MKAVLVERPGGPEVLRVVDVALPEPGVGEVRVRLEFIGVNFADVLVRRASDPPQPDVGLLLDRCASLTTLNLSVLFAARAPAMAAAWDAMLRFHAAGRLRPHIGGRFPLACAADAHHLAREPRQHRQAVADALTVARRLH